MMCARLCMLLFACQLLAGCTLLGFGDTTAPPDATPIATAQVTPLLPLNPEAEQLFAKARILWKDSDVCTDPALAVFQLDKAIVLQPDYADAYMRRGLAYSEMGRDDEAFADLTQAIRLQPSAERYAYRALGLIRQHNLAGARRDVEQSIRMQSSQFRAWNLRGVINMLEDLPAAACADFSSGCKGGDCSGLEAAQKQGLCR